MTYASYLPFVPATTSSVWYAARTSSAFPSIERGPALGCTVSMSVPFDAAARATLSISWVIASVVFGLMTRIRIS